MAVAKRQLECISVIPTAGSAMGEITNSLQPHRVLSVQAQNGINGHLIGLALQGKKVSALKAGK